MPKQRSARGVSTVEFVVVFPIALLVLLCLIQCGFVHMAKLTLNHATFMAARHGATMGGREAHITSALIKGLVPFYQDSTITSDLDRINRAYKIALIEAAKPGILTLQRLSPNQDTLADFGVEINGKHLIPHDNLQWRNTGVGAASGVNIQDANLLKVRVVYGYELKVPLMATLLRTVMCGGPRSPMRSWGGDMPPGATLEPQASPCLLYYSKGRVPIESYALVEMQSPFDDTH